MAKEDKRAKHAKTQVDNMAEMMNSSADLSACYLGMIVVQLALITDRLETVIEKLPKKITYPAGPK